MTELEGVVLGVIWGRGPCSAYLVRQQFERSTTAAWKASRGSIYPAIRRLTNYGYVEGVAKVGDGRGTTRLSVTEVGVAALADWVMTLSDWMGGATVDPIRSRVNYLGVLGEDGRAAFLERAENNVRTALAAQQAVGIDQTAKEAWGLAAAAKGAQFDTKARLAWLEEIRAGELKAPDDAAE